MFDLVVKDALIADGSGKQMFAGDVAVAEGRIAEVGTVRGPAREVVEAKGNVLSPGIIDLHTHYDAQLLWDPEASPSPALGVTTIVIGNCGFSLAPTPKAVRSHILGDLAVVEAISARALETGVTWDFETFGEYLGSLRRRGTVPNVGAFVGHSTVRTAVMREDAYKRTATPAEIDAMRGVIREALDAGAIGFATTQSMRAVGHDGLPIPSRMADDDEFRALVGVLREAGRGVYMHTGTPNSPTKAEFLEELAGIAGRPVMWASAIHRGAVDPFMGIRMIEFCAEATRRGHTMYAQTACHPMEHNFTLHNAFLFEGYDAWAELRGLTGEKMIAAIREPGFRDRFRAEIAKQNVRNIFQGRWEDVTISEVTRAENRAVEGLSVAKLAAERSADPVDVFLDLAADERLETSFTAVMLNADEGAVAGQLAHEHRASSASRMRGRTSRSCAAPVSACACWGTGRGRTSCFRSRKRSAK